MWGIGELAVGLTSAADWIEDRDAHVIDGIERVYVLVEPDTGGETVSKWLP